VTRRPHGAKPQVKEAQGLGIHTLSRFRRGPDNYAPKSVYKGIPCSRVSGDWEVWPAGHMHGYPAIHHLQTDSIKSVEAPLDLYIMILVVAFTHTTLYL
jgi:hypothetical protein